MDLSEVKRSLQSVSEYLAKQDAVRDASLLRIDATSETERQKVAHEIRVLTDAIDDAKIRRRFRVAESLQPRLDEEIRRLSSLEDAGRRAKLEIHRLHIAATSECRQQQKRLSSILENAAAMERQLEMQIRRHRKIPVM